MTILKKGLPHERSHPPAEGHGSERPCIGSADRRVARRFRRERCRDGTPTVHIPIRGRFTASLKRGAHVHWLHPGAGKGRRPDMTSANPPSRTVTPPRHQRLIAGPMRSSP